MYEHSFFKIKEQPWITAQEKFVVKSEDLPIHTAQAVKKVCKDPKFAYVGFNGDLYREKRNCRILQIPIPIFSSWSGFILRTFSSYRSIFNRK